MATQNHLLLSMTFLFLGMESSTLLRCRQVAAAAAWTSTSTSNALWLPKTNDSKKVRPIRNVMAPMVAASDLAFRTLVENHGAVDLCVTQMLHARHLVENDVFRRNHIDFYKNHEHTRLTKSQRDCIEGMPTPVQQQQHHTPGPLIVQLAGNDVNLLKAAFDTLVDQQQECQFAGVDLNLGCPQGIARKGNYGAFLHESNPTLVCNMLRELKRHSSQYTVSCKIRLPRSLRDQEIKERLLRLCDTGIDFITIHGRTLEENKTKTRAVHVDKLALAVTTAATQNVPVICNGGVEFHDDVQEMLDVTKAAAVMSSEALLETPNLFSEKCLTKRGASPEATAAAAHDLFRQQVRLAREYVYLCARYPPLPGVLGPHGSFSIVKGHLFKMLHRYLHQQVDLRDQLTCSSKLVHAIELLNVLEKERYPTAYACETCPSSKPHASWYRRHWHANTFVHQKGGGGRRNADGRMTTATTATPKLSVKEQKEEMKLRIAKLRQERLAKEEKDKQRIAA